ncbi:MAG TPA: hypothetical protein DCG57_01925, partial [Candidatus Riflebacteria bacterium]|nr:hypothetical protein [Candidatus Riflebacteria bacterium]
MIYRSLIAMALLVISVSTVFAEKALLSPFEEKPIVFAASDSSQAREVSGTVTARWKLNVRVSPWGRIIDGFKPGRQVTIVAREGDWYRIRHGSGFAYVHTSLIKVSAADEDMISTTSDKNPGPAKTSDDSSTTSSGKTTPVSTRTGGINGPAIPDALLNGLAEAKKTEWFRSHKCLQFAGTVAAKAGATRGKAAASQPQAAYPADTRLRGYQINDLPKAVEAGLLKPGMLIHVKIHYDKDPAYHRADNAHHWFVYMGKSSKGEPMFADNTHKGELQTAQQVYANMKGWRNSKIYGDSKYGYVPRVTAIHDP